MRSAPRVRSPPEQAIDEQIAGLEAWAMSNHERSTRAFAVRFFRGMAFLGAVAAAAGAVLPLPQLSIAGGAVAALAVAIDAAGRRRPTGARAAARSTICASFSTR